MPPKSKPGSERPTPTRQPHAASAGKDSPTMARAGSDSIIAKQKGHKGQQAKPKSPQPKSPQQKSLGGSAATAVPKKLVKKQKLAPSHTVKERRRSDVKAPRRPKSLVRRMVRSCVLISYAGIAVLTSLCLIGTFAAHTMLVDVEDEKLLSSPGNEKLSRLFSGDTLADDAYGSPISAVHSGGGSSRNGSYAFGRFKQRIPSMELHQLNWAQTLMQKKEFVWTSVTGGDWLVGLALLQFNFNAGVVINAFNRKTKSSFSRQVELPLFLSLFGPYYTRDAKGNSGLHAGCMKYDGAAIFGGGAISFCAVPERQAIRVSAAIDVFSHEHATLLGAKLPPGTRVPLETDFFIDLAAQESHPTMVMPLGPHRASVVAKVAGAPAKAAAFDDDVRLSLGGELVQLKHSAAAFDYTRGLLRRHTRWYWLSLSTADPSTIRISGATSKASDRITAYGLHLSTGTYDFVDEASAESTIFTNGNKFQFYGLPGVRFEQVTAGVPPDESDWRITGYNLDLTFTPYGKFLGAFHYFIIDGDLWHLWGVFNGKAPLSRNAHEKTNEEFVYLENVAGVLEDHYALW